MKFNKLFLGEVVEIFNTKRIPLSSRERLKMTEKKYPYYGAQGIIDYVDDYLFQGQYLLIAEDGENLRSRNKEIAIIATGEFWVNNHAHIIQETEYSNLHFLKETINRLDISGYLTGSAQPKLNQKNLMAIQLVLPPKEYQDIVGDFIEGLDDKINTNNLITSKLERISGELFKHWFIDFEFPNEQGLPYKSNGGKMVESELGEIPIGWKSNALKDIAVHKKDSITMNKIEMEFVNHFSIPNYDATKMSSIDRIEDIKSLKYIIDENSILFSKLNPNTPRIWHPVIPNNSYQNVCSTEFVVINSLLAEHNYYLLSLVSSTDFTNYLMGNVKGSTGSRQRVSPGDAMNYKFSYNANVAKQFSTIIKPLFEEIKILRLQNEKLSNLRDTLLPKLLSGEIELPIKETVEN